jgi:hypothetical protein
MIHLINWKTALPTGSSRDIAHKFVKTDTPTMVLTDTVKLMQIIPFGRRFLPTRQLEINGLEASACFCYALKSVNLTKPRMIYIRLCTFGNVLANPLIGYVRELLFRFIQHVLL